MLKFAHTVLYGLFVISLAGCGGSGCDTPSSPTTPVNIAPVANAGADQTVLELALVNLSGSGSDIDGSVSSYSWEQISGPEIVLSNSDFEAVSFTAPSVSGENTQIAFRLTVTDNQGATSSDDVSITVLNVPVSGQISGFNKGFPFNTIELSVQASGLQPFTYQWQQVSGQVAEISGADTSLLTVSLPPMSSASDITFAVTVLDGSSDATTFEHTVSVEPQIAKEVKTIKDPKEVTSAVVYDFDNDGSRDVIQLIEHQHLVVQRMIDNGLETEYLAQNMPSDYTFLHAWDADSDADTDFFMLEATGNIALLEQKASGFEFTVGGDSGVVNTALADCKDVMVKTIELNNDAKSDLSIHCKIVEENQTYWTPRLLKQTARGFEQVEILLNSNPVERNRFTVYGQWLDFDGDGNTDYFSDGYYQEVNRFYKGDGNGSFIEQPFQFANVSDPDGRNFGQFEALSLVAIQDFNNDGQLDFVFNGEMLAGGGNTESVSSWIRYGQSDNTYVDKYITSSSGFWRLKEPADYNQDGEPDLFGCSDWGCSIYLNINGEFEIVLYVSTRISTAIQPVRFVVDNENKNGVFYFLAADKLRRVTIPINEGGKAFGEITSESVFSYPNSESNYTKCDFFSNSLNVSGACIDETHTRIFSKNSDTWDSTTIDNKLSGSIDRFEYSEISGDGLPDLIYGTSCYIDENTGSGCLDANKVYVSDNSYSPIDSPVSSGQVAVDLDNDDAMEFFQNRDGTLWLKDDIHSNVEDTKVEFFNAEGTETMQVTLYADDTDVSFAVSEIEGELKLFTFNFDLFTRQYSMLQFKWINSTRQLHLEQSIPIDIASLDRRNRFHFHKLNNDGQSALFFEYRGNLYFFYYKDGKLHEPSLLFANECASYKASTTLFADIDLDGDLDIVRSCDRTQETKVFMQTDPMMFQFPEEDTVMFQFLQSFPKETSDIEDMDGDSDPDFIYVSDTVGYYENTLVNE